MRCPVGTGVGVGVSVGGGLGLGAAVGVGTSVVVGFGATVGSEVPVGKDVIVGGEVAVRLRVADGLGAEVAFGMTESPDSPQAAAMILMQNTAANTGILRLANIRQSCRRRSSKPGR